MATVRSEEKRQSAALWFGVLAGPIAWVVHVAAGYILEDTACSPASSSPTILGIEIVPLYLVMTSVLAAVTAAAGLVAYRCKGRIAVIDTVASERARWMAWAGVLVSTLFFVIIGLAFASISILESCEISP
ncbi:MAG: hypothetical protein ACRDI3_07335 [Actinomycetota bacterium]